MNIQVFQPQKGAKVSTIRRNTMSLFYIMLTLVFIISACKKDDEVPEEEYPVFGTCEPVTANGNLSISESNVITYTTSGGGKIVADPASYLTITHKDYPGFDIVFWGTSTVNGEPKNSGNHESLKGKRVKDRVADRRTIIFPDGAKITMVADGRFGQMLSISIFDGKQCHVFNPTCNTLEYSSANSPFVKQIDDAEADGETGTFEFTNTGLLYANIYTESIAGQKIETRVPIGEMFRDKPNTVNDYWTDAPLPAVDKLLTDVIRAADVTELKTHAIEVYAGTTPPIINGTVKFSPWRFDYAKPSIGITAGQIQKDITVEFSGQTAGKQAIVVKFAGDYLKGTTLISPFITGSGNQFTVCFKINVTTTSGNSIYINDYAYLISGSVDGTNLKNVKMAIVGVKSSIPNVANPSVEGDIAIYSDSNGVSERTNP